MHARAERLACDLSVPLAFTNAVVLCSLQNTITCSLCVGFIKSTNHRAWENQLPFNTLQIVLNNPQAVHFVIVKRSHVPPVAW